MTFITLGVTDPCNYCGTYCNYPMSGETVSMIKMNELRRRHKDTKTGVAHRAECDCCGTITLRWSDEKIKCEYCGELI